MAKILLKGMQEDFFGSSLVHQSIPGREGERIESAY
jgi:hypothetical protein